MTLDSMALNPNVKPLPIPMYKSNASRYLRLFVSLIIQLTEDCPQMSPYQYCKRIK